METVSSLRPQSWIRLTFLSTSEVECERERNVDLVGFVVYLPPARREARNDSTSSSATTVCDSAIACEGVSMWCRLINGCKQASWLQQW